MMKQMILGPYKTKKAANATYFVWELTKVFGVGREVFGFCVSSPSFMKLVGFGKAPRRKNNNVIYGFTKN